MFYLPRPVPVISCVHAANHDYTIAELFGSFTIYLAGPQADFLRGRFVAANWDVDDLEKYHEEIVAEGLLKGQPFKGNTGPGGHDFSS